MFSPDKIVDFMNTMAKKPASALAAAFCSMLFVHIMWSEGQIPGVVGYAKADEIQKIKSEVVGLKTSISEIRVGQLESSMFNLQIEICRIPPEQMQLKVEYQRRLASLQYEYRKATATGDGVTLRLGDSYSLPAC